LHGFGIDPGGSHSSPGKAGSLAQKDTDRHASACLTNPLLRRDPRDGRSPMTVQLM